jgi:heat-inducible transcriptional repressor
VPASSPDPSTTSDLPVTALVSVGTGRVTDPVARSRGKALARLLLEPPDGLLQVASHKVLLVATIRSGVVRTVYVDLPCEVPEDTLVTLALLLNERLAGQPLGEIRKTLPERLRDTGGVEDASAGELLNIFVQWADDLFDVTEPGPDEVHLGRTSVLARQPEFASGSRLKALIELTEWRDFLASVLSGRGSGEGPLHITIGAEHAEPELSDFTLVTSEYRSGGLAGVIGVIGPTRMPYEKVVTIVEHTSALVSHLLGSDARGGSLRTEGDASA